MTSERSVQFVSGNEKYRIFLYLLVLYDYQGILMIQITHNYISQHSCIVLTALGCTIMTCYVYFISSIGLLMRKCIWQLE